MGSDYFNYKAFFSVVLLALVDGHCNFVYIDVGAQGRMSDGGVFACTSLGSRLENGTLHVPLAKKLRRESNIEVPYVMHIHEHACTPYMCDSVNIHRTCTAYMYAVHVR